MEVKEAFFTYQNIRFDLSPFQQLPISSASRRRIRKLKARLNYLKKKLMRNRGALVHFVVLEILC